MKTIIVPVDFSEQSEYALKVAVSIAKKRDSEIMVIHMLELSDAIISSSEGMHMQQAMFFVKLAEKKLAAFIDKPYLKNVKVTSIIKHYKVFSELNEIAEKHNADLVVMGSHGVNGLKEVFVGSNAERVVRNSNIPVLVVKNDYDTFKIQTVVFACNFDEENIEALQKARVFAKELSARLDMVYINTPGDNFKATSEIYKRMSEFLHKAGIAEQVEIYNDYTVESGVLNYSDEISADLIAIPTHGRRGLSHFFMGSIGEDIANHSKIPVVTFKI